MMDSKVGLSNYFLESNRAKMKLVYKLFSFFEKSAAYLQGKGYAPSLKREAALFFSSCGNNPLLAIDIGGNVGGYTAELLKLNPNLEVHIFEPSQINIKILQDKFRDTRRVTINPLAVSEVTGSTLLYASESGAGSASLTKRRLDHFNATFDVTEQISAVRFEEYWVEQLDEREIDLVKIDVEGHELSVLRSFGRALPKTKSIQFEFGGTCIDTRVFFQDFWYFFAENHFEIFRITPFGLQKLEAYREIEESFYYTNFIAINKLYR